MRWRTWYLIGIIITGVLSFIMPWYFFILSALFFVSILFLACINLSWNFFIPAICKTQTTEKVVALTFDDGPALYTPKILDTLKQHNVAAAFFCIGKNIAGNEQILSRINEEGHIIGNHSYSHHFWFDMWNTPKMAADMRETDNEVIKTTGMKPLLFRPPYGVMNPNLAAAIKSGKYTPIGWSVRSFDTRIKDPQKLLSRIMAQVKPGGIILLHDSIKNTATILPQLIQQLKGKGYEIARLDKMLNINAYA